MVITTIGPVSFTSPSNSILPHTTIRTKSNKTNLSEPFTKTYKRTPTRPLRRKSETTNHQQSKPHNLPFIYELIPQPCRGGCTWEYIPTNRCSPVICPTVPASRPPHPNIFIPYSSSDQQQIRELLKTFTRKIWKERKNTLPLSTEIWSDARVAEEARLESVFQKPRAE